MKFQLLAIAALTGPAAASLRALQDTCAGVDERSQQCGADNPTRPLECCEGLICGGIKCVDPDALGCAEVGFRAMECGIAQQNRPPECCDGLVCNADKFCEDPEFPLAPGGETDGDDGAEEDREDPTEEPEEDPTEEPEEEEDTIEPTMSDTEVDTEVDAEAPVAAPVASPTVARPDVDPDACGVAGDKAEECGADPKEGRFAFCCDGLVCDELRFCNPGPPTAAEAPVAAPPVDGDDVESIGDDVNATMPEEPDFPMVETPEPTAQETDAPTGEPTDAATEAATDLDTEADMEEEEEPEETTSSASAVATGFAMVGALVAPLLV